MGLILKQGSQYADPRNGQMISNPYAMVVRSEGNRRYRQQLIEVNVFRDKRASTQGADPLEIRVHGAEGEDFDKFFAQGVLIENGTDPYTAAENYILQLPAMVAGPGEDDEEESFAPLEWGDLWEKE